MLSKGLKDKKGDCIVSKFLWQNLNKGMARLEVRLGINVGPASPVRQPSGTRDGRGKPAGAPERSLGSYGTTTVQGGYQSKIASGKYLASSPS